MTGVCPHSKQRDKAKERTHGRTSLSVTHRSAHQQTALRYQEEFQGGECRRASSDSHVDEY